jgi:hypothetical protein
VALLFLGDFFLKALKGTVLKAKKNKKNAHVPLFFCRPAFIFIAVPGASKTPKNLFLNTKKRSMSKIFYKKKRKFHVLFLFLCMGSSKTNKKYLSKKPTKISKQTKNHPPPWAFFLVPLGILSGFLVYFWKCFGGAFELIIQRSGLKRDLKKTRK